MLTEGRKPERGYVGAKKAKTEIAGKKRKTKGTKKSKWKGENEP